MLANPKPETQPMQPDAWIYKRSVLGWILKKPLRKQLPIPYRVFGWYCQLYFGMMGGDRLKGGRQLFRFLSGLFQKVFPDQDLQMNVAGYQVFLNPIDARLFQVVNELTSEDTDTHILAELLSEGDTFLDVGANHGSFAIIASQLVGKTGLVIAVEPQPRLARVLNKSLAANALCQFQIHNLAVGDRDGEIELLVPIGTSGSAGVFPEHSATHDHNAITVPLKRFDDLVNWQSFTGKVLLKLDVEGSECAFLEGANQMLRTLQPDLIIEIHPVSLKAAGATGSRLKNLLQELGYQHYREIEHDDQRIFALEDLNTNIQRNVLVIADARI